jgi:hypothetical protein
MCYDCFDEGPRCRVASLLVSKTNGTFSNAESKAFFYMTVLREGGGLGVSLIFSFNERSRNKYPARGVRCLLSCLRRGGGILNYYLSSYFYRLFFAVLYFYFRLLFLPFLFFDLLYVCVRLLLLLFRFTDIFVFSSFCTLFRASQACSPFQILI